ncbi:ABC transporter permease [Gordonia sp. CPCC 206044]|uniref:ABC transporter permease n=1 Tax=Gordonia sp. CPCC 206044 TaxID=3140793 RepID=UPI003AF36721
MTGPTDATGLLDDVAADGRVGTDHEAPRRAAVGQGVAVGVLATEKLRGALRSGDLVMAVLSPLVFFVCFYMPLHRRFEALGADYAQFLTPIILLQAGLFTAIAATEAAGADARAGVRERLASLPIARTSVPLARMVWVLVRLVLSIAAGIAIGSALGFRFHGTWWQTVVFVLVTVLVGLALSMLTDAAGSVARNSTSVAHVLMIPQLILVMASTGLVPAEGFPTWAQPFVRNQPLSVFTDMLRGLASGDEVSATAPVAWLIGLLVAGWIAMVCAGRAQVGR